MAPYVSHFTNYSTLIIFIHPGEELLTPTKIYSKTLLPAINSGKVKAYAHITGGGLTENIPRILPKHLAVQLETSKWTIPPVFGWVSSCGGVGEEEMARTFNCGVGATLIVKGMEGDNVIAAITSLGEKAWCIGKVVEKSQVIGKKCLILITLFLLLTAHNWQKWKSIPDMSLPWNL